MGTTRKTFHAFVTTSSLRWRLLITVAVVGMYVAAMQLSVPGVDSTAVSFCRNELTGIYGALNSIAGGAVAHVSPVALGVTAFITAAIMWMLLSRIIPAYRNNPPRAKKHGLWFQAIVGTLLVARGAMSLAQAANTPGGLIQGCSQTILPGDSSVVFRSALIMFVSSVILVGLALLVTKYGVANGFAILIGVAILAGIPAELSRTSETSGVVTAAVIVALFTLITILIVLGSTKTYRWPLYPGTVVGGGDSTKPVSGSWEVPFNPAGLIPAILASILASAPILVGTMFHATPAGQWILQHYAPLGSWMFLLVLCVLMFLMVFYQVIISYDSDRVANDMHARGVGFAGVGFGEPTRQWVDRTLEKKTLLAAVGLFAIAVSPTFASLLFGTNAAIPLGGTTLLVAVLVAINVGQSMVSLAGGSSHTTSMTSGMSLAARPGASHTQTPAQGLSLLDSPWVTPGSAPEPEPEPPANRAQRRAAARKKGTGEPKDR